MAKSAYAKAGAPPSDNVGHLRGGEVAEGSESKGAELVPDAAAGWEELVAFGAGQYLETSLRLCPILCPPQVNMGTFSVIIGSRSEFQRL